jgi:UDP-N-acetylglucosamine 2-epimerase
MDLVFTLNNCDLVITDSGGIQEEAVSLGKHVIVTRELTERGEGSSTGLMHVAGTNPAKLLEICDTLIDLPQARSGAISENPYGDGYAAARIVERLEKDLN